MTELILRDILVQICWSYCTPTSELLYKGWTSIVFISNHSSGNLNTLWVAASKLSCQQNFAQFYNYHQLITSEGPLMGVFSVLKLPSCAITLKIYDDMMSLRKIAKFPWQHNLKILTTLQARCSWQNRPICWILVQMKHFSRRQDICVRYEGAHVVQYFILPLCWTPRAVGSPKRLCIYTI